MSGRVDGILGFDCVDDLRDGDVELGQLVRSDPDAHGVLAAAEAGTFGNPLDAGHLIVDVDEGVVGQGRYCRRCHTLGEGANMIIGAEVDLATVTP